MEEFVVHLTREYVVSITANSEEDAMELSALYVSGGFDDSIDLVRKKRMFQINHIKPILNEAICIEKFKE